MLDRCAKNEVRGHSPEILIDGTVRTFQVRSHDQDGRHSQLRSVGSSWLEIVGLSS